MKDILRSSLAKELLQASAEQYSELLNYTPVPMWIYNVDTLAFMHVNEAAIRHYGYSRDEFKQMTLRQIRPAADVPAVELAVDKCRDKDYHASGIIYHHRKKNGDIISVRIESTPLALSGVEARMAMITDITSELSEKRKSAGINERLKNAHDIANLGYWAYDLVKNQITWSDELYNIFEVDRNTFIPTLPSIIKLLHPADRRQLSTDMSAMLANAQPVESERHIITGKGQEKWIYERIRMISGENGVPQAIEGITLDITSVKTDEQAMYRKNAMLHATNEFMRALLSHNDWREALRTSLSIIGETVQADRIFYFENKTGDTGNRYIQLTLRWAGYGPENALRYTDVEKIDFADIPELIAPMEQGRMVRIITSELNDSWLKRSLFSRNVLSLLTVPVMVDGNFFGFIGFQDCTKERIWDSDEDILFRTLITEVATIIEKKLATNFADKNKRQLNALVRNVPGITYRSRIDRQELNYRIIFISSEIERLTGYPASGFINNRERGLLDIIHPEDVRKFRDIIIKTPPDSPFELQYRIICADGHQLWVSERGRFITDHEAGAEYVDAVVMNVSELKGKVQELRESNERFQLVLQATREAIMDWDIEQDITVWGNGFAELFGYDLSVYDNNLWSSNIHPDDKERVLQALSDTLKNPAQLSFYAEFRFMKADDEIAFVQHRAIFIRDAGGRAIRSVGAMTDITETMRHLREIESQNAAMKEIAWIQSHVVRAPLATLMGLVHLLKNKDDAEMDESELLENIDELTNKLDRIIRDIVSKTERVRDNIGL